MYLYIFLEIIYLILILINFITKKDFNILNIGPIMISIIYSLISQNKNQRGKLYLVLSLVFSLSGDIFFILLSKSTLGVASFILVQLCYLLYLKERLSNKILIPGLLNIVICSILGKKILIIESIIYGLIFIVNIVFSFKNIKINKTSSLFLVALLALLICDINVAVIKSINLSKELNIVCSSLEWISYTINLIIITLLANGFISIKNKHSKNIYCR